MCVCGGGGGFPERRLFQVSLNSSLRITLPCDRREDMISVTFCGVQLLGKQPDHLTSGMFCKVKFILQGYISNRRFQRYLELILPVYVVHLKVHGEDIDSFTTSETIKRN